MIKNKLHTINDDDAIEVAKILLISSTSSMFDFTFEKIDRQGYIEQHGVDAEELVSVYFSAKVKHEQYRKVGWKDKRVKIQLIEHDRYHNYPYFAGFYMEESDKVWEYYFLSNQLEAFEFLRDKGLL